MAGFRIHEDNYFGAENKNFMMEVDAQTTQQIPQKRATLKEINIPSQKLPFRQQNFKDINNKQVGNIVDKKPSTKQVRIFYDLNYASDTKNYISRRFYRQINLE